MNKDAEVDDPNDYKTYISDSLSNSSAPKSDEDENSSSWTTSGCSNTENELDGSVRDQPLSSRSYSARNRRKEDFKAQGDNIFDNENPLDSYVFNPVDSPNIKFNLINGRLEISDKHKKCKKPHISKKTRKNGDSPHEMKDSMSGNMDGSLRRKHSKEPGNILSYIFLHISPAKIILVVVLSLIISYVLQSELFRTMIFEAFFPTSPAEKVTKACENCEASGSPGSPAKENDPLLTPGNALPLK